MSPPDVDVFEAGVSAIESDQSIQILEELDFGFGGSGAGSGSAAILLRDVVVVDDALVKERTDGVDLNGSGAPGFGGVARLTSKAAIVVCE